MSQILALDATQIVLIVLIALLVIAYPILIMRKNKKETQRMAEQTNSLKRGDKVLTTSGVYGKIVDIKLDGSAKQVTIETGTDKYKSFMTIDAYAIYQVIKDEPVIAKEIPNDKNEKNLAKDNVGKEQEKTNQNKDDKTSKSDQAITETANELKKENTKKEG